MNIHWIKRQLVAIWCKIKKLEENGGGGTGEIPDHNELQGLQGGGPNEYYHLTEDEYNNLGEIPTLDEVLTSGNTATQDIILQGGGGIIGIKSGVNDTAFFMDEDSIVGMKSDDGTTQSSVKVNSHNISIDSTDPDSGGIVGNQYYGNSPSFGDNHFVQKLYVDNLVDSIVSNSNVIKMSEGEYLMDIINEINALPQAEKPTVDSPLTIHFYNHSKTIDWSRFTAQIHWPQHVYLNFVGEINWWPNNYFAGMTDDDGLISGNPTDKLFIGFSFNRENADYQRKLSGLPNELSMIFFGSLDENWIVYSEWNDVVLGDVPDLAHFRVNGDKSDDVKNDALYKKINGVAVDVTPDFRLCNMIGKRLSYAYFQYANCQGTYFNSANCQGTYFQYANCQGAYFNSANLQGTYLNFANCQGAYFHFANCQGAYFQYANFKNSRWDNVISIANAKFQNADLTGAIGLPERINTKANFIAECGAGNVNAQTIWIDGTSILA